MSNRSSEREDGNSCRGDSRGPSCTGAVIPQHAPRGEGSGGQHWPWACLSACPKRNSGAQNPFIPSCLQYTICQLFFLLLISESTFFTLGNENPTNFVSIDRANSGEANSFRMPGVSDQPLSEKGQQPRCPVSPQEEHGGLKTTDRTETLACHSSSQSDN